MTDKKIQTKIMKQDLCWHHAYYTLFYLYSNIFYDDKEFDKMLHDLLWYVEKKILPPDGSGDLVGSYVIVEYEEK